MITQDTSMATKALELINSIAETLPNVNSNLRGVRLCLAY